MTRAEAKKPKPLKKRRVLLVLLGLLLFYIIGEYTIPRFPFGPFKLYDHLTPEVRAAVIPYNRLTDEVSYPFQQSYPAQYNYSPSLDAKRDHNPPIRKFPDVRACLIKSEQKKETPDLRLINWDKIRTVTDADVCTWRIFSSLGAPERAREWLKFHNAHLSSRPAIIVAGKWGREMRGIPFPTRGWRIFHKRILNPGMFVRSIWSEDGDLQNIYWRWQDPL